MIKASGLAYVTSRCIYVPFCFVQKLSTQMFGQKVYIYIYIYPYMRVYLLCNRSSLIIRAVTEIPSNPVDRFAQKTSLEPGEDTVKSPLYIGAAMPPRRLRKHVLYRDGSSRSRGREATRPLSLPRDRLRPLSARWAAVTSTAVLPLCLLKSLFHPIQAIPSSIYIYIAYRYIHIDIYITIYRYKHS